MDFVRSGGLLMERKYSWALIILFVAIAGSVALNGPSRLWGQRVELEPAAAEAYVFVLVLGEQPVGEYAECHGLGSRNDIDATTSVIGPGVVVSEKTPGRLWWNDITLTRIGPSDPLVWEWRRAMETLSLDSAIRGGAIVMYRAGAAEPVARWRFEGGWAASLVLNGAVEELTIVHAGLERLGAGGAAAPPARR
jgi:hypothetical protein